MPNPIPSSARSASLCVCALLAGCGDPTAIEVELSSDKPRFTIHHVGWGWPVRWPRVQEFAIASNEDGALWEIRTVEETGVAARELAIVYGEVPPGFAQVSPQDDARPKPLVGGRMYFVGATGPESVYRAVFALPIGMLGPPPDRALPGRGPSDRLVPEGAKASEPTPAAQTQPAGGQTSKLQNVKTSKPEGSAKPAE